MFIDLIRCLPSAPRMRAGILAAWLCLPALASATDSLTLMTYNIHAGFPMGRSSASGSVGMTELTETAKTIAAGRPDIVALQEVHCEFAAGAPPRQRTSALNQARELARSSRMHYCFGSTLDDETSYPENTSYVEWGMESDGSLLASDNGTSHGEFGNALLSRLPFETPPENIPLPLEKGHERRACLRAKLSGLPVAIYATHFQHTDARARIDQMAAILDRAERETSGTVTFILGDLNSADDSPKEGVLALAERRGFHDLHGRFAATQGNRPDRTFPADAPDRRIDYILCNRPLPVEDAWVLRSLASDHLPVVVRVRLGEGMTGRSGLAPPE